MSRCVRSTSQAVDEVVGRPWSGELQVALAHHGAGGGELVLVALDALAIDQVGDIQQHLAAFGHAAAYFFVQRREHAVHLEADGARPGLALALAGSRLAQVGEIFLAYAFQRQMLVQLGGATGVDVDLEVHFRFPVKTLQIALKLALVGANGLTKTFIVLKDSAETEGKNGGVFETVCDNSGMIDAGFLIESFGWRVFADDDG